MLKSLIGGVGGFLAGGPVGALVGLTAASTHTAARGARKQQKMQEQQIWQQQERATATANRQRKEKEAALAEMSRKRVRSSRRRVRGGLFGESAATTQYGVASRLGG